METTPDVTVLIVNYKTPSLCVESIRSLKSHTKNVSYEIVVVDNNSNDGIEELLKKEFNQEVRFFQAGKNLGTVRAYNLGKFLAHGRYLFLLNSDTLFINNAIFEMKNFLDKNKKTAMVGANLYHPNMTQAHSFKKTYSLKTLRKECRLPYLVRFALSRQNNNKDFNNTGSPLEVMYVSAAATLIRRSALDEVGWFSEERFMYGEEPDIAESFRQAGYNITNLPTAQIIHLEGASGSDKKFSFSKASFLFSLQGNGAFFQKWMGEKGQETFYRCLRRGLKNKELLSFLSFNRNMFKKYRSMIKILSYYLKNKQETDLQILSVH